MQKIQLYIFSGLGADERVFSRIHFPEYTDVHFVQWQKPETRNETLDQYINRLVGNFDLDKPLVLMGLSFGGIVAQEVSRKIKPLQTIIISSMSASRELPWYFRLYGNLHLQEITPLRLLKFSNPLINWVFGASNGEDKKFFRQLIKDADIDIVKWSISQVLNWRRKDSPENLFHIHGDTDRLLPLKNKNVNVLVKGGGHFMVYNKAAEIERIINQQLEKVYRNLK